MSFYFLTEFFRSFFRVLHEASSSWLKFGHAFQKHPVCYKWKNIYKNACMYTEKVTYIFIKLELDYLSVNYYLVFSASGLSSLAIPPLVCLSLGSGVIEILEKRLKISERKTVIAFISGVSKRTDRRFSSIAWLNICRPRFCNKNCSAAFS
jgi:hypothetical protein